MTMEWFRLVQVEQVRVTAARRCRACPATGHTCQNNLGYQMAGIKSYSSITVLSGFGGLLLLNVSSRLAVVTSDLF